MSNNMSDMILSDGIKTLIFNRPKDSSDDPWIRSGVVGCDARIKYDRLVLSAGPSRNSTIITMHFKGLEVASKTIPGWFLSDETSSFELLLDGSLSFNLS